MNKVAIILTRNLYDKCFFARLVQIPVGKVHVIVMNSLRTKFEDVHSSNGPQEEEHLKRLLKTYLFRFEDSSNEALIEQVPTSIRNFLLPYLRHIHSIDNTAYCVDNLFVMNESTLASTTLHSKFKNIMETLKKDLKGLTDALVDHLSKNKSTNSNEKSSKKIADEPNSPTADICKFEGSDEEWQLSKAADLVCGNSSGSKRRQMDDELMRKKSKTESDSMINTSTPCNVESSNFKFNKRGQLLVFVDGACFSNGKAIAKAGCGVWFNHDHPLNISAPVHGVPTNNNAEIQAATQAIKTAHSLGIKKIKLHTDSQFLINCMTQWIHKWKKNNWMTVSKQPVKNKESLLELDSVMVLMEEVEWEYVEGHAGIPGNEEADVLAKKGATLYKNRRFSYGERNEH